MASPQKENGYVPIANEIAEHLAKIRINGEAMQVLWVILRKTYGFNKKSDCIALSQFVSFTGLKKQTVCKAIVKLLTLKIITQKGNDIAKEYVFIKDFDLWKPLPKKVTLPKKVKGVTQKGYKSNPKRVLQKTKDTITKDIASQSDAGIISEVIKLFEGVNPTFERWYGNTTQRGAIDRMLVSHGFDKVSRVVALLPKTNTMAYFPTITTPSQLETDWAKLKSKLEQEKNKSLTKGRGLA